MQSRGVWEQLYRNYTYTSNTVIDSWSRAQGSLEAYQVYNKIMFKYQEEFDFSLNLVKTCGQVIKSAFHSEKKIR